MFVALVGVALRGRQLERVHRVRGTHLYNEVAAIRRAAGESGPLKGRGEDHWTAPTAAARDQQSRLMEAAEAAPRSWKMACQLPTGSWIMYAACSVRSQSLGEGQAVAVPVVVVMASSKAQRIPSGAK